MVFCTEVRADNSPPRLLHCNCISIFGLGSIVGVISIESMVESSSQHPLGEIMAFVHCTVFCFVPGYNFKSAQIGRYVMFYGTQLKP